MAECGPPAFPALHLAGYRHDSAPPHWQKWTKPTVGMPAYAQSAFWLILDHDQEAEYRQVPT
jgi:hypothetical protein